jgi:hypothetical protein
MTAADVRHAIEAVSVWAEGPTADRAEADRITDARRPLTRTDLYAVLSAAGLEGIRSHDSKGYLLTRLHNRLSARVRARDRAEV